MELKTQSIDLGSGVSLDLVYIPKGTFLMGSTRWRDPLEQPVHEVSVESFWIGQTIVTQEQWESIMGDPLFSQYCFEGGLRPVERITWYQAKEFCEIVSNNSGYKVRLPTEAEWEYAARGGTKTEYSFGDDETKLGEYAWFSENSEGQSRPVKQKKANPFGLYDIYGNVDEWVEDHWHNDYNGAPRDGSAWITENDNADRVLRGGYYNCPPFFLRSASRTFFRPNFRKPNSGFRVVAQIPYN